MTFKTLLKAGIVAGSALAAATASAVPVTFDFSNGKTESNATYQNAVNLSQGGVSLGVTGYTEVFGLQSGAQVSQWSGGLGVKGGASNTQVDGGLLSNELLKFDFSQDVEVQAISFTFFDSDDNAKVLDYDVKSFWGTYVETVISKNDTTASNGINTFTFSDDFLTSLLGISTTDLSDNFTVRSLTVNTKAAGVPEPSMIGLLGIGLIGLGMTRRRNTSSNS
jgi:hypothetical protein